MCRGRLSLVFTVVLFGLLPGLVSALYAHCDPDLHQNLNKSNGYRLRGDRCEGIYIEDVAAPILRVTSLTESFDYDLTQNNALLVEWTAPGDGGVRLKAQIKHLKYNTHYRMDTVRPPGNQLYTWPSDLLASLDLSSKNIGVVGWTRYAVGPNERNVYVPLRIRQQGDQIPRFPFSIELAFLSDLDNGAIPKDLRREFENQGILLSKSATILVKEEGSRWLIELLKVLRLRTKICKSLRKIGTAEDRPTTEKMVSSTPN